MNDRIACTPRTIPPEDAIAAAEIAVKINPQNAPNLDINAFMPEFLPPKPLELAIVTKKYWGAGGVKLTVGFLDNPSPELRSMILFHMNAWAKTANVEFVETGNADDARVRINRERMSDPKWDGYWSYLGTDILKFSGPNNQTMNLEAFTVNTDESEFYRVVRHETGHTLGFPHEHMRGELVSKIDEKKAIKYYRKMTGWSKEQIIQQVLTPLEVSSIRGTVHADPKSIMAYQVPGSITKDGEPIIGGMDIDQSDYNFAGLIYPKADHIAGGFDDETDKPDAKMINHLLLARDQFEHAAEVTDRKVFSRFLRRPDLVHRPSMTVRSPAPAAAAPDQSSLNDILNSVVEAPATTSIATVPSDPTGIQYQLLGQIQTLDSYISILTAFSIYNDHPEPYDITDPIQAGKFTQALAKYRNFVMTGGVVKELAACLTVGSSKNGRLYKKVFSADIHAELLTAMFGGFGFTKATMGELDSILTSTTSGLRSLNLKYENQDVTVDHFLTYYYFDKVQGTGGEGQLPAVYEVKMRLFYLKLSQHSWEVSIGKSSASMVQLDLNWVDIECRMNSARVAHDMAKINSTITTLTGQDDKAIAKLMNMKAVHSEPQGE